MIGKYLILAVLTIFFAASVGAQREKPPESSEIYRTVDTLWKEKQFYLIQQYLDGILTKWPNYTPAMVAEIGRLKLDGAQYPEALGIVAKIEKALDRDPLSVSPGFYYLFKSYSRRLDDAWLAYTSRSIGKEELIKRIKIENHWRSNLSWKQELLFLSVPHARVTPSGFQVFSIPIEADNSLKEADEQILRTKLFDLQISDTERYTIATELARRSSQKGIEGVVDALSHPTAMIVVPYLVGGFWEIAGDIPDEKLLKIFASNPSIFKGGLLWIIAKASPEHRFRAKRLMDKYAESFINEGDRAYAKLLKSAMKSQSGVDKYRNSFNNKGRPSPKGMKPFKRNNNAQRKGDVAEKPEKAKPNSKQNNLPWIIGGLVVVGILFKTLKNKSTS